MATIDTILFDWGNTLVCVRREDDAWQACANAAVMTLCNHGLVLPDGAAAAIKRQFGEARTRMAGDPEHQELDLHSVLRRGLSETGSLPAGVAPIAAAARGFWQAWTTCLDILDGADEVLARLAARGYRLGLVSNVSAPEEFCCVQLERLGLRPHLSILSFSSAVGVRKPSAAIYLHALDQVGIRRSAQDTARDRILFVGDSPECDVAGPQRLGLKTALIVHPAVRSPWPPQDYAAVEPTYRIRRLQELEALL